nr:PREDICTED: protein MGARP [Anolis carolinensis]|eukprot:XP_008110090.1 PREDICTED: protein MGARP [Anolis carolinensis]
MYLCRVAWQSLASRLTRAAPVLRGQASFRQMSGSVPGSSGENIIYYLLVIGAAGAGGFYAYRTISSDKARYNERVEEIQQRSTAEWKPKPWPPQSLENEETDAKEEVPEASEEAKDAVEKGAEETETKEEDEAITTDEAQVQNPTNTESTKVEKEENSPTEEASPAVQETAASGSGTDETQG